jgi:putative Ca2+/H+ antiporter (TMEM165/GDT1 family)
MMAAEDGGQTVHDAGIAITVFAIVFAAELPDKTAVASLLLGTKYRPSWVLAGVGAAFALHVALSVAIGSLLALLPHRPLEAIVASLFVFGAFALLRGHHGEPEEARDSSPGFWRVAATSFTVIAVAEFGDLTQLVTANLEAHYRAPLMVGLGAWAALVSVAVVGVLGGRVLMRVIPVTWFTRAAAVAMLVLAGFSVVGAVHG